MKKEERKNYTNRLKIAKFSAIILLLIQIGSIFVSKLMWDFEKNLNLLQNINLYSILPLIILSFFLFRGLVAIAQKEKLKSLEIIFWVALGISVIFNLFNLFLIMNYGSVFLGGWLSFIVFIMAITYIVFGLSFFQLQDRFGNIIKGIAIPNILMGIMFLSLRFIATSFMARVISDIIVILLEVIAYISIIIIFNRSIKSN